MQRLVLAFSLLFAAAAVAQEPPPGMISPARPVPTGLAPAIQFKLVHESLGERVYAIIFSRGDEVISGLTDFAIRNHITDAHFTAIGAVDSALLAWFDIPKKTTAPSLSPSSLRLWPLLVTLPPSTASPSFTPTPS